MDTYVGEQTAWKHRIMVEDKAKFKYRLEAKPSVRTIPVESSSGSTPAACGSK